MTDRTVCRTAGVLLGVVMWATGCGAADHGLAVLESASSARPVPATLRTAEQFAQDSARYLGEIDGHSYFAARPATGAPDEACLVQVDSTGDDWIGGCSTVQGDKVVVLSGGAPRQEVALVADDPATGSLEDGGWEKQADNLWQRTD